MGSFSHEHVLVEEFDELVADVLTRPTFSIPRLQYAQ